MATSVHHWGGGLRVTGLDDWPMDVQAMGTEGLDAPMPGQLLVLLSRLHRSETARARPDDEALG